MADTGAAPSIRVIVADDQPLIRSALRVMIGAHDDLALVAEAADGAELLEVVSAESADVILMDIRMPRLDGIEATRRVLSDHPSLHVLVLTTYDLDEYVVAAIRAGASGFLLKDVSSPALADAIRRVYAGDAVLAPSAATGLMSFVARTSVAIDRDDLLAPFTPRERDVLLELVSGASNAVIGQRLYLTENTVKSHVKAILLKLGVPDRVHVLIWAYENGIIAGGSSPA